MLILLGTEILHVLGAFGPPLTSSYLVPALPGFLGVRVTWQGASIDAIGVTQISNGVTYVHW